MTAQHTPGPWKAVRNSHYWEVNPVVDDWRERGDKPHSVADVCCTAPMDPDGGLQEANARLIAAAPELLDALRWVLPMAKGYAAANPVGRNAEIVAQAEDIVAKAEGAA